MCFFRWKYTLNYLSESKATFSKLSIYVQGQGKKEITVLFPELWPFENLGILNVTVRYLGNYLS